jgi:hypothetical protein
MPPARTALRAPLWAGRVSATLGPRNARMAEQPEYWFPAKRYGWGWGSPRTWQGWVVLAVFFAMFGVGFVIFSPAEHGVGFFIYNVVLVVLLIAVCYAKGESPRWRWGK